jgi:hypothetical protein
VALNLKDEILAAFRISGQNKLPIPDLRHPFRPSKMTVERAPRPIRLLFGVNMPHDPRDLALVGAVRMGIEHAEKRRPSAAHEAALRYSFSSPNSLPLFGLMKWSRVQAGQINP